MSESIIYPSLDWQREYDLWSGCKCIPVYILEVIAL